MNRAQAHLTEHYAKAEAMVNEQVERDSETLALARQMRPDLRERAQEAEEAWHAARAHAGNWKADPPEEGTLTGATEAKDVADLRLGQCQGDIARLTTTLANTTTDKSAAEAVAKALGKRLHVPHIGTFVRVAQTKVPGAPNAYLACQQTDSTTGTQVVVHFHREPFHVDLSPKVVAEWLAEDHIPATSSDMHPFTREGYTRVSLLVGLFDTGEDGNAIPPQPTPEEVAKAEQRAAQESLERVYAELEERGRQERLAVANAAIERHRGSV